MIPAEPIRMAIEAWLEEREEAFYRETLAGFGVRQAQYTPLQQLTFAIWGEDSTGSKERIIGRLMDRRDGRQNSNKKDIFGNPLQGAPFRQEHVKFELADLILTKIGFGHLWHTDPDLSEAYMSVDLSALDQKDPCVVALEAA